MQVCLPSIGGDSGERLRLSHIRKQQQHPSLTTEPLAATMDQKIPYDDYQLPVVFLPSYENPPAWIPPQERLRHPDYNNELTQFLPRTVILKKPPGAQLGFNIRGGKASQLGIFISKVVPDSDAHRAGLQEGDQVLSVNEVDFQDIEHSRAVDILKTAREILMRVRFFPYNYQRQKERTVH
ncbi:PDZ domain-containing protein 11 isoform X2 [Syngnathoides biaculeatus]|uniref:PDZ domain-containing protein 11 isoform X2 n=1 Tax=Syngnathoides biaculeatus TaxID=300417 RepID=UPI002ADDE54C|nr:PDZ domain-containing protein 11 isoform X2 [Syngnathoides biaculeatus]